MKQWNWVQLHLRECNYFPWQLRHYSNSFNKCSELKTQGETLNRTAAKLDHLNAKADEAEHTLRGMSSIWATMKNKLFRKKPKNAEVVTITKSVERDLEQKQERSEFRRTEKQIRQEQAQEDAQRRVNQTPSSSSVLNEQDQLLEEISKSVMRLGEISREAGHELDMQAKVLDQIHESSERANVKLKANTKAAKILAS